ncbi:MAG: LCP family protein [Anaerolineales bacterium]|jgi:LCP family protein required for cell wall assembly
MKSNRKLRKLILPSLGFIIIVLLLVLGIPLLLRWNTPLAPGLDLPTFTPTTSGLVSSDRPQEDNVSTTPETPQMSSTEINTSSEGEGVQLSKTPAASLTPSPTVKPFCGGPPVMTVLALGIDTRADNYLYGLADVIRIVRVDFVTPKVTVLSLPRDLWVEIPGIDNNYGVTHGKLNQSYFYGTEGMGYYDGPGGAPGLMARTLAQNFNIQVDHYGSVNMVTFVRMVDAVGGIDIYLPHDVDGRPVDDKTEDMGYFTAGQQHFNGDQALRFSRIRKVDTVFDRMDRQTMVLCALRDKLLSPSVLPKIPQLIASFQGSVITDLSLSQLSQLACLAPRISRENLLFTSLPTDLLEPSRAYDPHLQTNTFIWDTDYDIIRDYLARFQAGTWPEKPKEPSCP